ncbi:MAG: molybdopterin-dependent oxidoreductase, partial [Ignavibacteriaceae bacterium]|nr:molybdopterin-dependent oxidoreductase [Ignavibacteriaceae bacterium]
HKDKRVALGPRVMFDGERCISCSRCIRFCDEIARDPELTFVKRGDRVTIVTYPGEEMDNPYSMNTIDICPVGALTSRDFRFKARVWDMSSTNSICTGCSRGCNTEIWVRNNEILRLTPRHNEKVNSYWMCDHGRLNTFKFVNADSRINSPQLRKDGQLIEKNWDDAVKETVSKLQLFKQDQIAVIGSPYATCEDNYLVTKFARTVLQTGNLDFICHIDPSFADDILRTEDLTPNSLGAELVGVQPSKSGLDIQGILNAIKEKKIKALYLIEDDIVEAYPEFENAIAGLEFFVVHSTNQNKSTALADIIFPAAAFAEKNGTFVNINGMVQRIRPAVSVVEQDRALDGMSMSRLDKFGTQWDRWASGKKINALPTWKILTLVAKAMGAKLKFNMAEEVFSEIANSIEAFKGLDYDVIGELGAKVKSEISNKVKVS